MHDIPPSLISSTLSESPSTKDATKDKPAKRPVPKKKPQITNENVDVNNKDQKTKKKLQRRPKPFKRRAQEPRTVQTTTIGRPVYTNPSLGPGTLILANGNVLPVVTRPAVAVPSVQPTAVIVMHQTAAIGARPIACRPGVGAKVPIPALAAKPARIRPPPVKARRKATKKMAENRRRARRNRAATPKPSDAEKEKEVEAKVAKEQKEVVGEKVGGICAALPEATVEPVVASRKVRCFPIRAQ